MECVGTEVSQKIRSAIKAKLMEIGVYVDEELPDYVMVMVVNKRSKEQMDEDLQLFLGKHTSLFTSWLHQVLQKLQEVTVANSGGKKRKITDDLKKKKKSKQDSEKKELKKKIKVEFEDNDKKERISNSKFDDAEKENGNIEENGNTFTKQAEIITSKSPEESMVKETKNISESFKQVDNAISVAENRRKADDLQKGGRSKAHSVSSQLEEVDDEDCINIRTDGELLDTTEEMNAEEPSAKSKDKERKNDITDSEKRGKTTDEEHIKQQNKTKSVGYSEDKNGQKVNNKKQLLDSPNSPKTNDKVIDARELLNRKKAAKQSDRSAREKTRSRERSMSPTRRRKDDDKVSSHRVHRDTSRRTAWEDDKDLNRGRSSRNDDRERRRERDRDTHSSKRRGEERSSGKNDTDKGNSVNSTKRNSSDEPPPKRAALERPFKNVNNDKELTRSINIASSSDGRKVEIDSSVKKREPEQTRKRTGLASRVVSRHQEPEDDVENPVPSVVKVTPRPRRPPSLQPSSTLIMKAISEANKSLANVPPRPDSTQRTRKEPVFTRTLRQLERIPPEKIAVSITNQLALKNVVNSEQKEDENETFALDNQIETNMDRSPSSNPEEVTSSELGHNPRKERKHNEEFKKENKVEEESQIYEMDEADIQVDSAAQLEVFEEQAEEMSDPQFVVTLNGYDPDGLFSQSEMDLGEDVESNDWIKENVDEKPLLTSTPDEVPSPRPKRERNTSPIVIMNTPAVNHSNLIEVELLKTKTTERCKYWPACRLADKCVFYHPTKPCKLFPACKFGDGCLYIHPQCKYNALCTRKDCVFAHTPAHTPLQVQGTAVPKTKALYASSAPQPCKFYPNCTNINCQFTHPSRLCRFGLYCTKKDCSFDHAQVAPVDKLKWTRVPTT